MKFLITGISGYLGFELAKKLTSHTIIGVDIKDPKEPFPDNVIFIKKSILDPSLEKIFEQHLPQIVIHLAWTVTPVHKKKIKQAFELDYNGTKVILEYCTKYKVQYLVFMSSTLAYGALETNPSTLTEASPLRAKKSFHYAYHKRIVEQEIIQPFIQENPSIVVTVVRAPGFLGPTINNYIAHILRSSFLPVMIGGRNTSIQFLHISDLLDFFSLVIDNKVSGIFNVAPDDCMLMKDIPKILPGMKIYVPEFIARLGISLLWFFHAYQAPSSYLDFVRYPFIASNKKAQEELGWRPNYTSKDAILTLLAKESND